MNKFKPEIPNKMTADWQKLMNSAIESSTNAIVITDLNGKLTYGNDSFLKMWGFDDDKEVLGRRLVEFWQVKDQALKILGALRERDSWEGELAAKRKDGSNFEVDLSINTVTDEAGNSLGMIGTFRDITKHRKVEEALHESEDKYRRFLESLADGCFVLDRNWRYIFVNDATCQFVKYTRSELLGNKITKLFPGIEDTPFFQAYKNTMDTGKTNDIEAPFPRPDGTPGYLNIRVSAVPEGIVVIARDITERKRAEAQLRLLSSVVEQCSEGVAVSTLEGNLLFVNDAFAAMHGYGPEELVGKHLSIFHTPEQMPSVEASLQQIKETGKFSGEIWHVRRDGTGFPGLMQNSLLRDEAGNPIGMIGTLRDITELKRMEESLRESESQYRLLAENVIDVIWTLDMNLRPTYVSPSTERLLGYTVEEVMSQTLEEILTPASFETAMKAFEEEQAIEEKEQRDLSRARTLELELKCKDGSTVWVEGKMNFLRDHDGQAVGIVGVVRDITERKRTEEALRESESQYRLLAENITDVIWTLDMNLRPTYVSSSVEHLVGYTVEEVMSQILKKMLIPASFGTVMKVFEEELAIEKNEQKELSRARTLEFEVKCKDGSTVWVEGKMSFLRDQNDQAVGIVGIARDITERKEAEEMLRESEDRFRQFFENAPEYCYMISPEGVILNVNNAALKALGYKKDELVGKPLRTIYAPELLPRMQELFEKWKRTGKHRNEELVIITKEGDRRTVLLSADVVRGKDGEVLHSVSIQKDITERKEAEAELLKRTHDLGKRIKELNCLYGFSHIIEKPGISLEEIYQGVVEIIPASWQYPEITCARIVLEDQIYKTNNFNETDWKQSSDILVRGERIGCVDVFYLEERPEIDEGPFLQEERALLDGIAERLGKITERKRAEEMLRESEENYKLLVENAAEAINVVDSDGRYLLMNKAAAELLGGKPQDFTGKTLWDALPQEVADERMAVISEVLRSGKGQISESSVPFQGVMHYFISSRQPIKDGSGKVNSVLVLSTDITELKRAEEALQESEESYRELADSITDIFFATDKDLIFTYWNKASEEMTGIKAEDALGKSFFEIFPDGEGTKGTKRIVAIYREVLKTQQPQTFVNEYAVHNINYFFEVSVYPTRDGLVVFTKDITERKKAETELLQAQKQRLASIGQIAAGVAHEINNPLMALSGEIQLLLLNGKDKELVESLNLMNKLSKRIAGIVTDLVTFSREISTDVREASDINSLIKRISLLIEGRLKSKNVEIKKKLGKNLPNLIVDKGQIGQVFMNILMNSLDAMPDGSKLTISTKLSRAKDAIEIIFMDTGSGIAKENLPKIFDPFFSTKPPGKGVGMGLSVSYRIIENHSGSIKIDSKLNEGTKVSISLPITETKS